MDKKSFMNELAYHLRELSSHDRNDILQDYEDQFKIAEIEGKDEQSIILELGTPRVIAQKRLADLNISHFDQENRYPAEPSSNPSRSPIRSFVFALILIVFNIVIVLGPAVALVAVWISVWAVAMAFSLSPIGWVLSLFWRPISSILPEFFIVLTLTSIGVLLAIVMIYVTKILFFAVKGYLKWNIDVIRG
ncbi:hypothetical protein BN1058_00341 [Paraliobacillus sp. PM-2]|uniref:DUF1700 domain-containing protein n=1 Tax=Paraliobacillus sp. PM-2 TaxID=1462524 RepID=UPI00061BCA2F|nr:DUF1700 domain-containing protein [Paraliobacillus sp. PM-2]CQR46094.1 hypothetical protein BN1058_00341 [Paraliobacillus sp. PM-2]